MAGQVLRVYGICTVILVCLVELDWAILAAWWPLLESWLGRAALQSFLAVLAYRWAAWGGGVFCGWCPPCTPPFHPRPLLRLADRGTVLTANAIPCREGLPRNNTEFLPTLALFRVAASAALLACAALYFLGWVTCLGTIKSSAQGRWGPTGFCGAWSSGPDCRAGEGGGVGGMARRAGGAWGRQEPRDGPRPPLPGTTLENQSAPEQRIPCMAHARSSGTAEQALARRSLRIRVAGEATGRAAATLGHGPRHLALAFALLGTC